MASLEVISVHVPKCAGTSLRLFLESSFGHDAVYQDYGDRPADPASPMNLDPDGFFGKFSSTNYEFLSGKRAVHGHFNPLKYKNARARLRITFLRDPVERAVSHYFFWKELPRHGHTLHDYFLDHDLGIEEFARLPVLRRFYSGVFFGGVDMASFDLIGFHDRLEEGLGWLQRSCGMQATLPRENANSDPAYQRRLASMMADAKLTAKLRDILREDLDFYERMRSGAQL